MTNPNTPVFKSVRPLVKAVEPNLYVEHTFHMKKCVSFTYNYVPMDDYIVQHWATKTQREIANDLNEYVHRVVYRCQVLKRVGLINAKWVKDGSSILRKEQRELRVKLRKVENQLRDINAA